MTGQAPSSEVPAALYPFMVKSEDGRDVPVVQAYAFGKYLGYLKVTFSDTGDVLKATGNPILLDSTVPEGWKGTPHFHIHLNVCVCGLVDNLTLV